MDLIFLILSTLCIVVTTMIISMVHRYYVIRKKVKNIPQVDALPLIGSSFELIKLSDPDRQKWVATQLNKFPDGIYVYWIGGMPYINVYKPEYLEIILPSTVNITKGYVYNFLKPWLGNGLLISTGAQWFHDRKLIGPTFHFSMLDNFAVVIHEKTEIFTKCLEKEIEKNPGKAINIFPFAVNLALDIICETAMGVNVHAQEVVTKYTSSVHKTSVITIERMLRPWQSNDSLFYLMSAGKKYKSLINVLHNFTNEVIKERKITRQSQNTQPKTKDDEIDIGKRKRKAFLDLLLDQNEKADLPLTDDEVRAQVDTFMFEGHDTTAVAITWTLFCLGNSLECQEKVHQELDEVFKDSEAPATTKELSQLKYLDRVIKESLRIFPSVPAISRQLEESVKIGDYTIPKGIIVVMIITSLHRNPAVWPDPLKFDPDRFLPENSRNRNPYAYVPFSAGPRNCIGQRFAQLEEKTVLTAVLRKWRVKSVKTIETIQFGGSLILRPCEEVLMHFTPKK